MAKNNDAGVLLFFGGELSIAVGIEPAKNGFMRVLAAMILKHLEVHAGRVSFAEALDELDLGVNAVIVANESADKADHYDRFGRGNGCISSLGL